MRTTEQLDHPEITEFVNICAISPDHDSTREVCARIQKKKNKLSEKEKEQKKLERELDKDLKDTFPASDPVTHY